MNADGSVNVHCRKCGHFICRRNYTGFSTAICYWCEHGLPRPPDPQEELLAQLFGTMDADSTIEKIGKPKRSFNILDMMINTVQALGFRRREVIDIPKDKVEYQTADKETSSQIAKRKQRVPIFKRDKDKK